MKSKVNRRLGVIVLGLACLVSPAAGEGKEFDLGGHGMLSIAVPEGWRVESRPIKAKDGKELGYDFIFEPPAPVNALGLLTLAWTEKEALNREEVNQTVLAVCRQFVAGSVEQAANLEDFSPITGLGGYCIFTDASLVGKEPTAGEYKAMASGVVQPGEGMLGAVTLLTDDPSGEEFRQLLGIVNSLKLSPLSEKGSEKPAEKVGEGDERPGI